MESNQDVAKDILGAWLWIALMLAGRNRAGSLENLVPRSSQQMGYKLAKLSFKGETTAEMISVEEEPVKDAT